MFAITRIDDLWVTANFKETSIRRMHPGQSVTISVDALAQNFDGYIENMPGATGAKYSLLPPENATGNYVKVVQRLPVRIRFKQVSKEAKSGCGPACPWNRRFGFSSGCPRRRSRTGNPQPIPG